MSGRYENLFDNSFTGLPGQRGSSSTLGNLFSDTDLKGNADLTYTAKKQPKKTDSPSSTSSPAPPKDEGKVLFPLTTTLFLFDINTKAYADKGKVGSVLVRYSNKTEFLVYNKQNEAQVQITITPDFFFAIQNKLYGSFYDNKGRNWSLLFASEEDALKLGTAITVAKLYSSDLSSVTFLDVQVGGKGKGLVNGDSVSIKYSGWLEKEFQKSTQFDSNLKSEKDFRFTLGQGKVIKGWEEGIQGMKKESRRILVIPSTLAYGASGVENTIPPHSILIFDVLVTRVKRAQPAAVPEVQVTPAPSSSSKGKVNEIAERLSDVSDEEIHNRSRSGSGVKDEALLSRMAKLGRATGPAILPSASSSSPSKKIDDDLFSPQPASSSSQSSRRSSLSTSSNAPAVAVVASTPSGGNQQGNERGGHYSNNFDAGNNSVHSHPSHSSHSMQGVQGGVQGGYGGNPNLSPSMMHPSLLNSTLYSNMHPYSQQGMEGNVYSTMQGGMQGVQGGMQGMQGGFASSMHPTVANSMAGVFQQQQQIEGRTFQLEMKSNLNHLQSRVDEIHSRMENSSFFKDREGKKGEDFMAGVHLIQGIQRLVDDNEKLRSELAQKVESVENLREKIAKLHEKNEKFIEENNRVMEQRNEALKESGENTRKQLKELIEEKAKLEREINESHIKITENDRKQSALQRSLTTAQSEIENLKEEVEKKNQEIGNYQNRESEAIARFKAQAHKMEEQAEHSRNLDSQIENLNEEIRGWKEKESKLTEKLAKEKEKREEERKQLESEKESLEASVKELENNIRKQRLESGIATKEELERVENEVESRYRILFDSKKVEFQKATRLSIESTEKPEWERIAFENGRKSARDSILSNEKPQWEKHAFEDGKQAGVQSALLSSESASAQTISELQSQLSAHKSSLSDERKKFESLQSQIETLQSQLSSAAPTAVSSAPAVVTTRVVTKLPKGAKTATQVKELKEQFTKDGNEKVKKIMNGLYSSFYEEIDEDEQYEGSNVLSMLRGNIKTITLELINNQQSAQEEEEEEEEEETEQVEESVETTAPQTKESTPPVESAIENVERTEEKEEEKTQIKFLPEFSVSVGSLPIAPQGDDEDREEEKTVQPSSLPSLDLAEEEDSNEKRNESVPLPSSSIAETEESEGVDDESALPNEESDDDEAETEVDEPRFLSNPASPAVFSRRPHSSAPTTPLPASAPLSVSSLDPLSLTHQEDPLSSQPAESVETKAESVEEKEEREEEKEEKKGEQNEETKEEPQQENEEEKVEVEEEKEEKEETKETPKEEEKVEEVKEETKETPKKVETKNPLLFGSDDDEDVDDPLSFASPKSKSKTTEESTPVKEEPVKISLPSFEEEPESPRRRPEEEVNQLIVGTPQLASPFGSNSGASGLDSGKKKVGLFEDDGQFDASSTFGSEPETKKTTPQSKSNSLFQDSFAGFESEEPKSDSTFDFGLPTPAASSKPAPKSTKEKARATLFGEESLFDPLGGGGAIGDDGEDFLSFLSKK